jgi:CheY-specific phosphatase CheX
MFFVFAEPSRNPARACRMKASIDFKGPFSGRMQIRMKPDLLGQMAKNMLNLEDNEVTDSVMEDCIKEAMNMVCGSFLPKVEPTHIFNLSIPTFEMITSEPADDDKEESEIRLVFTSEDSAFEVRLWAPDFLSAS